MTRTVALIGGSGFLGTGLRDRLVAADTEVIVVGRGPASQHDGWRSVQWDAVSLGPWVDELGAADTIVHLAGKRVDCRPSERNPAELIASRAGTVDLVGAALERLGHVPDAWIQLSSLARFGDVPEGHIDEYSRLPLSGVPQQVKVCRRWEQAFREVTEKIPRTVLLRPGIAIGGAGDPATKQMTRLVRFGLAGPVAGGRQWVSWIAAEDMFALLRRAVTNDVMSGTYHLTAPEPVTNREFMAAYRRALGRRFGLPAPRILTQVGARLLGSDPALVLTGRAALPRRLLDEGYTFAVTDLDEAVDRAISVMT